MSISFANFLKNLISPDSDLSLDGIREKYGDSVLKSKDEINKITNRFYKEFNFKPKTKCLHPISKECSGKPIRSHSIQKSQMLLLADETNHVLMFNNDLSLDRKPNSSLEEIGINQASIFPGLCAKHDFETFEAIENNPIDIHSNEQQFLFAYRAILKECLLKTRHYDFFKRLTHFYSEEDNVDKLVIGTLIFISYSHYLGMFYTNKVKRLLDISLIRKNFDSLLDYQARTIEKFIPISVCSAFTPTYDIEGKLVNNFTKYDETPNYVFLNVFPTKNKTYLFCSTLKLQAEKLKSVIAPFAELETEKLYDYLSEVILKYIENVVVSPNYWQRFSGEKKTAITKYFNDTVPDGKVKYDSTLHNLFI
jgi:hypothetical protein